MGGIGILDRFRDEELDRLKRKRFGLYRGIARDVADPEARGRVRCEVHELLGAGKLTDWASYSSPFGGGGAGLFMLPRPGDGVWVMFERGEPTKPVWLGFWYSSEDPAPAGAGRETRVLQSKAGHRLVFVDEAGKESIRIEDSSGQSITWDPLTGRITVTATAKIFVTAPEVDVGAGVKITGVSTECSHPVCYVTGQPIGVSRTVRAEG